VRRGLDTRTGCTSRRRPPRRELGIRAAPCGNHAGAPHSVPRPHRRRSNAKHDVENRDREPHDIVHQEPNARGSARVTRIACKPQPQQADTEMAPTGHGKIVPHPVSALGSVCERVGSRPIRQTGNDRVRLAPASVPHRYTRQKDRAFTCPGLPSQRGEPFSNQKIPRYDGTGVETRRLVIGVTFGFRPTGTRTPLHHPSGASRSPPSTARRHTTIRILSHAGDETVATSTSIQNHTISYFGICHCSHYIEAKRFVGKWSHSTQTLRHPTRSVVDPRLPKPPLRDRMCYVCHDT